MQKHLNTPPFAPYLLLERIFSNGKAANSMVALITMLLVGLSQQVSAQTKFVRNFVVINGTRYYTTSDAPSGQAFQAASLGSFTRGVGSPAVPNVATLTSESNVSNNANEDFTAIQLLYRVYPQAGGAPDKETLPFIPLGLNRQNATATSNSSQWLNNTTKPNLLTYTSGPPEATTYVLEVSFQGAVINSTGVSSKIFDPSSGTTYAATFVVSGNSPPVTFIGYANGLPIRPNPSDWFTADNWSNNQVPDQFTDVNIKTNANGQYPIINTLNSPRNAAVRNLTIGATKDATGGNAPVGLTLNGDLFIYGNFQTSVDRFKHSAGRVVLAGATNQTIFGTPAFVNLVIQGGFTKTLTTNIQIQGSLTFNEAGGAGGGILATLSGDDTDTRNYYVELIGDDTRVSGETENSYVQGTLRSVRSVIPDKQTDFGNIGIVLTPVGASSGTTTATRVYRVYNGVGTSVSIQRSFIFATENQNVQNFSLAFRYLDTDLNGIKADDLVMFRTISGGVPFQPLNKTFLSTTDKILTRSNIQGTLAATFTLGDNLLPLPVTVTSFAAVAQGSNALLTWTTAQEVNSKGFEVQVLGDGTTFRKLGFVASAAPNSSETRTYKYSDTEAGKQGTRYYRLRQLDLDGKESFFGPQAVTFGASALTSVQGYPNPFGSEINLTLQATTAGPATVSVFDGVGRQVRVVQPTLAAGASSLRLGDLQSLPHGLYVVQVRYSDGQTQRLKVVKE